MSETANFSKTPRIEAITAGSNSTSLLSSSSMTVLFVAGVNGSRLDKISVKSVTSTASDNMIRFFIQEPSSSVGYLFTEIPISSKTSSVSTMSDEVWQTFPDGIAIPYGYSIWVTSHNTNLTNVIAYGGDF